MADVEPPQRKRKVEETSGGSTTEEKMNFGGFVPKSELGTRYVPSWSDDEEVDPELEEEYYRRIRESDGFDVGDIYIPDGFLTGHKCGSQADCGIEIDLYAQMGLHCFNFQKGTNLRLMNVSQYNTQFCSLCTHFITLEAIDPANNLRPTFQTCVTRALCKNNEHLTIETDACRYKPATQGPSDENWLWDDGTINDFYRGNLPNWLLDDTLIDKEQYYEVQDPDVQENDWLQLYSQVAFYSIWQGSKTKFRSSIPLEIKKVVVQTRDAAESHLKLKASNAIFYMRFSEKKGPDGSCDDYRAIVRRTMDGKLGHLRLEVQCWCDNW